MRRNQVSTRAARSRTAIPARPARKSPRKSPGRGAARLDEAGFEVGLDALVGHVGYSIRRFQMWIFQDFIKTLSAVNIRPAQYSVMTVIGANPGMTQMAVAKRLGIERARLVHLLDSLEERNLVKRVPSRTDRRSHALHLTPGGQASLRQFKLLAAEHERHVDEKIGPENRRRLLEILSAFH
ncbi:MarR family winged helix-turn-helix transcriptional regulator [Bradyrhizobium sediminis]|uniref:MarR family winged helix-turn-helix transcriptional regulator n=2 Tax=Bradyrhizobium sediminis TaxID=2840469 RepID=A0A975NSV2_9BRAD|nr:MarR family winged helix-turn-helix transcriptional regulator [Bradyrhizobium sediminis]